MRFGFRLTFSIGARDVPKLIGRAGATIKDLRTKSGCSIQIGEESDNRSAVIYITCVVANAKFVKFQALLPIFAKLDQLTVFVS